MSVLATSAAPQNRSNWLLAALVTLAAPLLLYLVVRTAALGLSPPAAAALPPADYTPLLRRLLPAFADPRIKVPPQVLAMARSSATAAPLAYEPLFIFGKKAADDGNLKKAIVLMEEARRRRPNFLATRILLMAYYAQAGRYSEAIADMEYALRSSDLVRRLVLPELAKTLRNAEGRRAVAAVVAEAPPWREEFIRTAENQSLSPAEARDFLELVRARRPNADLSLERQLYLQALVRSGQAREGRRVWLQALPEAERASHEYIFDGAFTGRTGAPPFGWVLHDGQAGRAEIVRSDARNSHLEANYFGGNSALLAEQMLALSPGAYELSFAARSDGGIRSGEVSWVLSCAGGGGELARVRIVAPQPAFRRYQGPVRIPASGCSAQNLRLVADPGDVAAAFTLQVDDIRMVRR